MARPGFMVFFEFMTRHALADDRAIGAWLRLHTYCASIDNGGRIKDCKGWGGAMWARVARVHPKALQKCIEDGLAMWADRDLMITDYDHEGASYYKKQGESARKGARAKWGITDAGGNAGGMELPMPVAMPVRDALQPSLALPILAERSGAADGRHPLARSLSGLFISDSEKSIFQWETLIRVDAEETGPIEDQIQCLEWCVEKARKNGAQIKYAEQCLVQAHLWRDSRRKHFASKEAQ